MEWDTECQESFDKIKRYLENPLVLVPAALGRPLILYLMVLEESMGCMLGQQDATAKKEQAIYYLIAKNDPVKYIFEKPALTGRITRWQMALSEYDILYVSWKAVKGSALAKQLAYHPLADSQPLGHEFLDEHIMVTTEVEPQYEDEWTIWFDEASNIVGNGVGVVLILPKDLGFPFATKLGFDYTNNMAEYKAGTMGLLMALEHQVRRLKVFGDSTLVIYQLRGGKRGMLS
ncbi:hypothetical protein CR513_17791, partial [Mucuna pruriens]